jgi:predicted RecB family nuclease
LDFETIQFAVPIWKGTRPYQQLPFQWSCHVEPKPGEFRHEEFLDTTGQSPLTSFIKKLVACLGENGPIFVYSHFERTILGQLAEMYPDQAQKIQKVIERLVDLFPLAKEHYYHPQMKGSWSIKSVLPTIAPDLDYGSIEEVQDGTAAQIAYLEVIDPQTDEVRKLELSKQMLEYCKLDTLAMVRLVRFFEDRG